MRDPIQRYFQVGLVSGMAYAPQLGAGESWPELVRRIAVDGYFQVVEVNPLPDQAANHCRQILVYYSHVRKRPAVLQFGILLTGTDKATNTRYIGTADISG